MRPCRDGPKRVPNNSCFFSYISVQTDMQWKHRIILGVVVCAIAAGLITLVLERGRYGAPTPPSSAPVPAEAQAKPRKAASPGEIAVQVGLAIGVPVLVAIAAYLGPYMWLTSKARKRARELKWLYKARLQKHILAAREVSKTQKGGVEGLAGEFIKDQVVATDKYLDGLFVADDTDITHNSGMMHPKSMPWFARIFTSRESREDRTMFRIALAEDICWTVRGDADPRRFPLPLSNPLHFPGAPRGGARHTLGTLLMIPNLRAVRGILFVGLGLMCAMGSGVAVAISPDNTPGSVGLAICSAIFFGLGFAFGRSAIVMEKHLDERAANLRLMDEVTAVKQSIGRRVPLRPSFAGTYGAGAEAMPTVEAAAVGHPHQSIP